MITACYILARSTHTKRLNTDDENIGSHTTT